MAPEPSNLNALGLAASLVASYLSFAGAIIAAAIWPIFGLFVIYLFRPHLVGLLPFVQRFELWGARVELQRGLAQAEQVAVADEMLSSAQVAEADIPIASETPFDEAEAERLPEGDERTAAEEMVDRLRSKPDKVPTHVLKYISRFGYLANTPAATIALAWDEVRRAIIEAAVVLGLPSNAPSSQVVWMLPGDKHSPSSLIKLLDELESIHLSVLKAPGSADLLIAARFASLAQRVISSLRSSVEQVRSGKTSPK